MPWWRPFEQYETAVVDYYSDIASISPLEPGRNADY